MAKAGDLLGRSGAGGLGPNKPKQAFPTPEKKEGEAADHSATQKKPVKDSKPHKGGGPAGGGGSVPTGVRPKV